MKRVAWVAILVLATLTLLLVLWQLRMVVVLFLLSVATAAAFRPLIAFFEDRRLPRAAALALAYALVIGLAAGLLFLIGRPLLNDLQNVTNQVTMLSDRIENIWPSGNSFQRLVAQQMPSIRDLTSQLTGNQANQSIQALIGLTGNIFSFIGNLFLILILSIYWSADYLRIERLWLALLPVEARPQARETYHAIETGVGAYIRSEVIQSLLAGIMLWAGYQAMGLQYAVLMALFGALAWLIPWFGALLAIVPPLLVGLSLGSLPLALLAVAYTLFVLFIQEWLIEPRFFRREVFSSVILVVMILLLADQFGLIGLIIAPLVSAAVQITLRYLAQPPVVANQPVAEVSEVREEIAALQEKADAAGAEFRESGEEPPPELVNLTERLKKLLVATQAYLEENPQAVEERKPPDTREKMPLPGSVNTGGRQ